MPGRQGRQSGGGRGGAWVDYDRQTEYPGDPLPAPSGPTVLRDETFASDPAPRWGEAVGVYLPTGGADGLGAFDLSADDAPDDFPDTTLSDAAIFGNTADAPNATATWSVLIRASWAFAPGQSSRVILLNDLGNWAAALFINPDGDGFPLLGLSSDGRDGTYSGTPAPSVDLTGTLDDGEEHWLALDYTDTPEVATIRAYVEGVLVSTVEDATERVPGWYPTGVRIDGPEVGTMVLERVIAADGEQTVAPPAPPAAPTALLASVVNSTTLVIEWAHDGFGRFSLERSPDSTTWAEIAMPVPSARSYTDTELTPATEYSYRMRARNVAGSSAYTAVATATTPA